MPRLPAIGNFLLKQQRTFWNRHISVAHEDLVEQHSEWLTRVIQSRLPDSLAADDVLQEVSLAVLRTENPPEDEQEIRRWICRIAITQCALAVRQNSRKQKLVKSAAENGHTSGVEQTDPIFSLIAIEEISQLEDALTEIDSESQKLLNWKFVDKLTYAQIAERLNLSKDAAEYRVMKARELIRETLLDLGFSGDEVQ